ncbi:MAG: hypothetical protein GWN61_12320, partial [candidate division Zixibacteria bacterium]|nr:hypothetical protein [candidate division Zixibacteria bacterium]NIW45779.1 hypothetical protein [Gammaproteobacteria bacterium]
MDMEDIINVSEDTFEQDVLDYSRETPVFVLFWAIWSPESSVMVDQVRKITMMNVGEWRIALV